jgi:hypothetical protein
MQTLSDRIKNFNPVIDGTRINIFHPPFELIVITALALFAVMIQLNGLPLL